jgi:hypothetical protein
MTTYFKLQSRTFSPPKQRGQRLLKYSLGLTSGTGWLVSGCVEVVGLLDGDEDGGNISSSSTSSTVGRRVGR